MKYFYIGLLALALLPSLLQAQCAGVTSCSASSCTANAVADALDSITLDNTVMQVPSCPAGVSWGAQTAHTSPNGRANVSASGTMQFLPINSFTMQGQSTIATTETLSGLSNPLTFNDNTNLIYNNSSAGANMIQVVAHAGKSIRITGLTLCGFDCSGIGVTSGGVISIVGISQSTPCAGTSGACVRVDHVHFKNLNNVAMVWGGWNYGVADHNLFDMHYADSNGLKLTHAQYGSDANATGSLSQNAADNFGNSQTVPQAIFIENNTAQQTCSTAVCGGTPPNQSQWIGAINDCSFAGREVIRYNTFIGMTYVQTHEMEGQGRGCRVTEIYKNYAATTSGPDGTFGCTSCSAQPFHTSRAGPSLVWGNTLVGNSVVMNVFNNRDGSHSGSQGLVPNGWGYCGSGTSGQTGTSVWDQNTTSNGYACLDQPGRGQGDLVVGNGTPFTNILNSTQGNTRVWPRQALDPIYVWNNTWSAQPAGAHYFGTSNTALYAINRDFYIEIPNFGDASTFNGTVGIGNGTLVPTNASAYTNAPNCIPGNSALTTTYNTAGQAPGVGYWDTTNQTLYICTATNTWTSYYTPYTYPHPLVGSPSGPVGTLSPTSLVFGNQGVGTTSASQTVTFTNTGTSALTISTITTSGDFSQTNNCPFSPPLGVGASCTFNVFFTPTTLGSRIGNITINSNATNSPSVENLSGTGVAPTLNGTVIINGTITINGTIITQ